jgi:hypothetical protein
LDTKELIDLAQRYGENRDFITNEETAKAALVIPFIRLLGYDPSSPKEVRLEFTADFVQGDGKKYPDRMDFAIFDKTGSKPLMVIETKPLGTDLKTKSQQLARYLAQLPDLHFGIITDGCRYMFFGDLDSPNQMDKEPFFAFSLDDPNPDWPKVAGFLSKFSRDAFNAETLVVDAENSRYRQIMIERLAAALKSPAEHDGFLKWLTDFYEGKRTISVMARLGELAREAVEPALLRVIGEDFVAKLKERIQASKTSDPAAVPEPALLTLSDSNGDEAEAPESTESPKRATETTDEELQFFRSVSDICCKLGTATADIVYKDTQAYFNLLSAHRECDLPQLVGCGS